jgi:cholesterol transport system auxiliary component
MRSAILIAAMGLSLAGCVKIGSKAPPQLLSLTSTAQLADDTAQSAGAGDMVTIAVPMVPQTLAASRVAVTQGPVVVAYVKDGAWAEPPARLFRALLSETIAAKTGRVVVDPRQVPSIAGTQLSGHLRAFGMDADRNEAHIIYDAALVRKGSDKIETRRFEAREAVSAVEAVPSGLALNKAANVIASEVATWIGAR